MGVARIGHVRARAGSEDALLARLRELAPQIASLPGCLGCEVMRSREDPAGLLMIERWTSIDAHRSAVMDIPKDDIAEFMKMVDGPMTGEYYDEQ